MTQGLTNMNRILSAEEFEHLFSKCRPLYIAIANSYVHDAETAADLVHDSFVKLWEKRNELRTGNYEAWLFETVINRCLDSLKSRKTRTRILQNIHDASSRMLLQEIESLEHTDPGIVYAREVEDIVRECMEKMPTITRKIFMDHRFENKTYKEISEENGIPSRRVAAAMQTALKMLRASLKDYIDLVVIAVTLLGS